MVSHPEDTLEKILLEGELELHGEFMWGSNYTFLLQVEHTLGSLRGVYKPTQGVRPLWDFPTPTLARREVAAYLVSKALGWELVPPTVLRDDGPYGPGSIQLYVEHDPEYHYFKFTPEDRQRLRPTALFDMLINNADRKGSHILIDPDQHIWLIDHGICFHVEDKLRTVIWDFAGETIPEKLYAQLDSFIHALQPVKNAPPHLVQQLRQCLSTGEVRALRARTLTLLAHNRFRDTPPDRRAYPWPPV